MGEHFGSYEILRRMAAGGMAEVFLARQRGLGGFERLVCVKRILPHLGSRQEFVHMFMDEARIAANLVHPSIAQIYDFGEVRGVYYIAMEYVRGEDLRHVYNQEVARGRGVPAGPAAQIAMGAASGLDYAHRHTGMDGRPLGIVHRDVGPQNILVTYDGHVKLVDFGVAKAAGKIAETRTGVLKGKYSYMSPEQAAGEPVDARTDVFALGVTLYEVTTGQRLFKRDSDVETLQAVAACKVAPPSELLPGFDPDLEAIVMRALACDAGARFQTAGELAQALERFLAARGHATGEQSLAAYMQELFAEKLADEPFGGQHWDERLDGPGTRPAAPPASGEEAAASTATRGPVEATTRSAPETRAGPQPSLPPRARYRGPRLRTVAAVLAAALGLGLTPSIDHRGEPLLGPEPQGTTKLLAAREVAPGEATPRAGAGEAGLLSVTAPIELRVSAGERTLGRTPVRRASLEPGAHTLRLTSAAEGFVIERRVELAPGATQALDVALERGYLAVNATPWARVRIGRRPAVETPARLQVYAGDYQVTFECEDGRRRVASARVRAGETAAVAVSCRQPTSPP